MNFKIKTPDFLNDFFYNFPALFYALFFLIAIATYLYGLFLYSLIFLIIFFIFSKTKKSFTLGVLVFAFGFLYTAFFYSDSKKITEPIEGKGLFKITNIKEGFNYNRRYYIYQGFFKTFETKDKIYHHLNTSIFAKKKHLPNTYYKISGTLSPSENFHFKFKTNKNFKKSSSLYSFVLLRSKLKQKFHTFLKKSIKDRSSANFLNTLITGSEKSDFLANSFSKIGLQHVLAISGFHFGLFTLFFAYFLRLFLPKKLVIYSLIILVNLYFLFVGPMVSVQRAFIMIQMALVAPIVNRRYFALNALGISLIIILLFDPINLTKVGFQLSFLSSFAILSTFPIIDVVFSKFIKKRTPVERNELNPISKIGDKLLSYIRQCMSLTVAVNIFILPVILYHFHMFSCLSFIYNLFIPFLVGISMFLVIFALIFHFTFLSSFINYITTIFTKFLLKLITYPPAPFEFYLRYKGFSFEFVICYLILITIGFLMLRYYLKKDKTPEYCHFL
ncbi:MAG: hypothetical protein K1000chlam1_00131 [Candidatus Anoxychlamydiales bacterium]|nr:hypothetical protein [Candidatus Anoxychlamydiales bacterium]